MKVIGKDRTSCDVCNPIDEIIARLDALERRASAIVAKVQGIAPDGEGNVTLPTSSSDTDPLHGRVDAFAMSSEVKEAADDAHAYAASIADDVLVINSEIDALNQAVEALQTTLATLESTVATYGTRLTAVEDADTQNVKLSGDQNISGIKTVPTEATGSRSQQIANSSKVGAELDNYAPMVRTTGSQLIYGRKAFETPVCEGTKDTFREYVKFTDVVREESSNRRCYISSVLDSNDRSLMTTEIGVDNSGKRAYYAIRYGGIVVNGNFLIAQFRLNLTETGVSIQLFDPISSTWKTVVLH